MSDNPEPAAAAQKPEPQRLRNAGWLAIVCVIALAIPALRLLTSQGSYPAMSTRAPALPAQGRRLVIVVADGLRYDFATNPKYAPSFARNMRRHSSAEVWAGQITMTSAAVLSFGTGTRGSFAQVVLNVETRRTQANHLFENARATGMKSGLIGDPVWHQAYGDFDFQRVSTPDLALDVDDTPELFAVAHELLAKRALPDVLVLHFFAVDHLQHSFGTFSQQFREFFLTFDANLQKFLDALPKDTTVVALSDHGALDNGNHGVDSTLERKTPMFAYGPGVRPGQKLVLEQVDVAPTLAALLGVPSPAHGIGMPVTELLDAPPERLAALACSEAERVAEHGEKTAGTDFGRNGRDLALCEEPGRMPAERIAAARRVARHWDGAIVKSRERGGSRGFGASLFVLLAFGALVPYLLGLGVRHAARAALAFGVLTSACVALTSLVDRTLPPWNDSRAAVMWVATGLLSLALFVPRLSERIYTRAPLSLLALAPGVLFASFPTNTQIHAGVVALAVWAAVFTAALRAGTPRRGLAIALIPALAGLGVALRLATEREGALAALAGAPGTVAGLLLVVVWLGVASYFWPHARPPRTLALELAIGVGAVALSVLSHHGTPAALGLASFAILPVLALLAARRGFAILARALLFATYGLVSRPIELCAVAGAAILAESFGALLARSLERAREPLRIWPILVTTTALFAFAYTVRLGVQGGLDFVTMDWHAGAFDSTQVAPGRITLALVVKYGAALGLIGVALLSWLPGAVLRPSLRLLTAGLVLRFATMAAILFAPWVSFWSRYRMLGELGPVLVMALLGASVLIALDRKQVAASEQSLVVSPSGS